MRGASRILKSEFERLGKVAQKLGADLELNPATGTYRLVFKEAAKGENEEKDRERWNRLTEELKRK
jgi:hypothetical protein